MAHILLIEDDTELLERMRVALEESGHAVRCAVDGVAGLRSVDEQLPDLVVTDLVMPEKEGIETIMELGERHPGLPIIAMGGREGVGEGDALLDAQMLGAAAAIGKPFGMAELIECVETVLATRHGEDRPLGPSVTRAG